MTSVESNNKPHPEEEEHAPTRVPNFRTVSWFRQFYWCLWKNKTLLMRRPAMLTLVLISSIISMVISWAVGGRTPDANDVLYPPESAFTECGSLDPEYIVNLSYEDQSKLQMTLNENWRDGLEVAMMGLGALFQAIFVFTVVNAEVNAQLLGVLRALGLRDSVYWFSWYIPFANISLCNAMLGAITAKLLPGHVYESVFFAGIFASLFFLNLALVSASLFLVALCGTGRRLWANFLILFIILAAFIPLLVQRASSILPYSASYSLFTPYPVGLFWQNSNTEILEYDYYLGVNGTDGNWTDDNWGYTTCNQPIMNEFQGTWYKTEDERMQVPNDEFFVGCYMAASWPVTVWKQDKVTARFIMFFFPYFHFNNIWGNFVGFTAMPNRMFATEQATMSPDELAIAALPRAPSSELGLVTDMAPQGSMFITKTYYEYNYDYSIYRDPCPLGNHSGAGLCEQISSCGYAQDPGAQYGAPSVAGMIGMLFALSVMYLLMAGYWATVFCQGNGKGERFYFFLLPSYWRGGSGDRRATAVDGEEGVVIDCLKKTYGNFEAVKGVSFKMNAGEVTALLGHNGAGKTTLSNILCCEIERTDGDIRVFGHSVFADPFVVRGMVGLCKQDDYLWPNLSAKEHLELFAGLRDVATAELEDTVQKWLESVDLDGVQHQYAGAYSGGMKRRLSLALATIGDRPLIVLDEPTTGMDPVSRRFVWRHIDAIKEGRVILLTTHAMEEADLLADEVAIMRKGELAAFGSPLQLKTEHGTALQFSILVDKTRFEEAIKDIDTFFSESKEWVKIEPSDAGNISIKISSLEDHTGRDGIDVPLLTSFVSWLDDKTSPVTEYGFSNCSLEEIFLKVTEGDEEEDAVPTSSEAETVPEDEADIEAAGGTKPSDLARFTANLRRLNQASVLSASFWRRGWTGRGSIGNYVMFGLFLAGSVILMVGISWISDPTPWLPIVISFMSLLLIAIIGPVYADRNGGQFYLMKSQGLLPVGYIAGLSLHAFTLQFVYNFLTLTGIFATPFFRDSEVCEGAEVDEYGYYIDNCNYYPNFGSKQIASPTEIYNFVDTYQGDPVTLRAYRAPGGYGMVFGIILSTAFATVGQTLTTAFFPGYRLPIFLITFATVVVSSLPLLPVFLWRSDEVYMECSNKTNPDLYCDMTFSRANVTAEFVDCVGFQASEISTMAYCVSPSAALMSQFGMFQMLSMAYSAQITFISEPEGYVQDVFIPSLDGLVKCKDSTCSFPFANHLFGLNFLFTILGGILAIGIGIVMAYTLAFPVGPFLRSRQAIGWAFGRFRSCSIRSPTKSRAENIEAPEELSEVDDERREVTAIVERFVEASAVDEDSNHPTLVHSAIPRAGIPPVIMHKLRKVYPTLGGRQPKVALESLDLHVPKGQVLGLLGKNGAGKTTALKILAGAHDSTGGVGLVAGYDCDLEKISVFERLGNCAQFDVVWEDQSVQRHLEFFAALKGLPKDEIQRTARAVANAVGLGSDIVYARAAGCLSGGMRRRLSIGLALIGSPAVVILDEPTTGLDPSTRSSMWSLIHSFASSERSMIITTHMMIEADTLCNRIAIVANGKLVVVGTQQHLKNKFGDGYVLQLNLVRSSPEHQERAMDFVRKHLHPDAKLGIRQAKTLHVNLPRDCSLEKVFQALYGEERTTEGGINQFLLSQSSLEDVFIALGD